MNNADFKVLMFDKGGRLLLTAPLSPLTMHCPLHIPAPVHSLLIQCGKHFPMGAESVCTLVAQKPTTGRMKSFPQSPRLPSLKSHHELIPLISVSLHRGREEEGLREGGVSCSCGKVFVWSCVTQCKDPEAPMLICSSRSPSRHHIIKIIPQPSTESLFVTWLAWLSSVKSSPITVSGETLVDYLIAVAVKQGPIYEYHYLLVEIKEWVDSHDPGALVIPFSGSLESQLQDLSEEEQQKHCTEHKTQSALSRIIKAGYAALLLEYFFTTGPDEVCAWTVRKGTKAPQAAGKIHTDFEKGFIMAEVMKFQDFKEEGSENAVKAAGKYRQRGRNYEDGDIIFFKFNTPNAQKKK
ncbi:hypothetical protein NQZ68_004203 [Dissostichus eleginoides]|nr:hypothetical protein NQZ68_004203 [Dissostichus eleginoides]